MAPRSLVHRSRKRSAVAATLAIALTGLTAMVAPAPAAVAAPAPAFDCTEPRFFAQAEDPVGTVRLNTGSYNAQGESVWTALGPARTAPNVYNAVAFNPVDGYLYGTVYGTASGATPGSFIRIDRDGTITQLGESSAALGSGYNTLWDSGEFDAAGTYYVASGNSGGSTQANIRKISGLAGVTSTSSTPRPTLTTVTLSPTPRFADFTFKDGFLWAPNYGQSSTIYRIDVNNTLGGGAGKVASFTVPSTVMPTNSYGSAFTMTNGNLAFIGTNGFMYQISVTGAATATPQFELVSKVTAPANQRSNATNCSTSLPSHLSIVKTGPSTVMIDSTITWTVTVTNDGPGITSGFVLTDALPNGLRDITAQSTDTSCVITGTKTVTCNGGRLGVGDTAVVTVSATAPHTPGPLANSATVVGNEDPSPPAPSTVNTEVGVFTTVDHPVTIPDATATSGNTTSAQGGAVVRQGGAFVYTPPAGFSGKDSFTYQTPTGTVTVNVDIAPIAAPVFLETSVGDGAAISVTELLAYATGSSLTLDAVGNAVNGVVEIDDDVVRFTPPADFSGTASFEYTVRDADGLVATGTVTVTVHNRFEPGDGVTTPHNTAATIPLSDIATAAGSPLDPTRTEAGSTAPSHGTISITSGGGVTYTPAPGYAGADRFTLWVYDTDGEGGEIAVEVAVLANTVTARGDTAATNAGTGVAVDVRANDTSASGQSFSAPVVTADASHGTTSVGADGRITYTPAAGFSGSDSFSYRVCDTSNPTPVCGTADVAVTVLNVFSGGTAVVDGVATPHNTAKPIDLDDIATTAGQPIDPTRTTVTGLPAHGAVTTDPTTGTVTYTPEHGYTGADEFELRVCDADDQCVTWTIEVAVAKNVVAAAADSTTTGYVTPVNLDVRSNDTSASGQALAAPTVSTAPAHGAAAVEPDGSITYTPDAGFSGTDSFVYRVCDTSHPTAVCATATATVVVGNLFTTGTAVDDGAVTPQNEPKSIPLADILTASGAALDPAGTTVTGDPANGGLSINPVTGAVVYSPSPGYAGDDEFELQLRDVDGVTTTVVITVTVLANTVTANDDTAAVAAGGSVGVDVRANDDSESREGFAAPTVTVEPSHGTAVVESDGTITYAPDAGFSGEDAFEYEVCDTSYPTPVCDTAEVTVAISNVFTSGTAVDDGVATPQNTPKPIPVSDIVTTAGLPVDPAGISVTSDPSYGLVAIDPSTGEVTYTPDTGYTGDDEFELQLCDANGDCTSVTIEVKVAANAVAAANDSASTPLNTAVAVEVRTNDTSASGQPLAAPTVVIAAGHGSATVGSGGVITYTPDAGFSGEDTFGYRVCDTSVPTSICDAATVTITVLNEFVAGPATVPGGAKTGQGDPLTIPLDDVVTATGAPLDPATVRVTGGPTHGTVVYDERTGEFSYSPDGAFSGDDAFTFEVCDESVPSQCTTTTAAVRVAARAVTGGALGATGAGQIAGFAAGALGVGLLGLLLVVLVRVRRRAASEA